MRSRRSWRLAGRGVWLLAALAGSAAAAAERPDPLAAGFRDPPPEARPTTYWLWINGYVNRQWLERELRAYRDAGLSGVCLFDMGGRGDRRFLPPPGPPFLGDQSVASIAAAVRAAERLGMSVELSVASSWDMGGAWVTPEDASKGLYQASLDVEGPAPGPLPLPLPPIPPGAPRRPDGRPAWFQDVAVLGIPQRRRWPGHDFVFQLDPPGVHTLDRLVLCNTPCEDPQRYGPRHLYARDFSLAVAVDAPRETAFREVLRASLAPHAEPQTFPLRPRPRARYVRLRILSGHNPEAGRVELGECELWNTQGVNVLLSHEGDRSRDGAQLLRYSSALGHDRQWTAANIHDGVRSGASGAWSSAGPPPVVVEDPQDVLDLTDRLEGLERLRWSPPPGRWTILRLTCLNTGERLKAPSPASDGLATDHLSAAATRRFIQHVIDRLAGRLGPLDRTALRRLYLASYEVRGPIWTPDMLDQFRRYRGYDMRPYLPALAGCVVRDEPTTSRFLYDYRKTLGDLLVDAYYRAARETARRAGLGIEAEAGGPGPPIHNVPVDALKALGAVDEMRGEFWPKRPEARRLWVVKETACAAHIYGRRRVHMEAFTSMHHWQDGPVDLKPSADRAFCEGANHLVWHTAAHLPPEAGKPGWVYGAGTHLNTNLVWWPYARPFLDYLARCSFLLQQGRFVGDVCYYYGDQGFNFVPPKHVDPSLGPGYDYDVINAEALVTRLAVRDGRLVLPDGLSYALLVLPDRPDIDLEALRAVERLAAAGATIVGRKPERSTGLSGHPERDEQVRRLADRLWGACDGRRVREHRFGQGRIIWGRRLRDVLAELGLGPDVRYPGQGTDGGPLDYIHRRTDDAEIYFVRNRTGRWLDVPATFRVRSGIPERWDPATGEIRPQRVFRNVEGGVELPLRLPPYGAAFVVFRARPAAPRLAALRRLDGGGERPPGGVGPEVLEVGAHSARLLAPGGTRWRAVAADGRSGEAAADAPPPLAVRGPWRVRFPAGWGAPPEITLDRLLSWTDHPDEGVRYFSGVAEYEAGLSIPHAWRADADRVWLDLGDLWAVAEVRLNGRSLGVLWKPPYRVDATGVLRDGSNRLVIRVANTWSNRLVGDARRTGGRAYCRTNIQQSGGRRWADVPLKRSGLFGPVRLVPLRAVDVRFEAPGAEAARP